MHTPLDRIVETLYTAPVPMPHTRKPLDWVKRRVENNSHLSEEGKSHVIRWTRDIADRVPDDPRLQAVAQSAVVAYCQIIEIQEALFKLSATSAQADKLGNSINRWVRQLTFCLRLAGLRKVAEQGKAGTRRTATSPQKDRLPDPDEDQVDHDAQLAQENVA
jgi:hypothetical protein